LFPALFALFAWEWLTDFPQVAGIVAAALYFADCHVISEVNGSAARTHCL
jgi:hypothetical protein